MLARDRAGKKPLFYLSTPDRILFASEIKAFFAVPGVAVEPDPSVFPQYFLHGYVPGPRTLYRDVRQVEPATVMSVSASGAPSSRRYWSLHFPDAAERRAQRPPNPSVPRCTPGNVLSYRRSIRTSSPMVRHDGRVGPHPAAIR